MNQAIKGQCSKQVTELRKLQSRVSSYYQLSYCSILPVISFYHPSITSLFLKNVEISSICKGRVLYRSARSNPRVGCGRPQDAVYCWTLAHPRPKAAGLWDPAGSCQPEQLRCVTYLTSFPPNNHPLTGPPPHRTYHYKPNSRWLPITIKFL